MNNERYWCVNCSSLRELNTHGCCGVCNSTQVISEHILKQAQELTLNEVKKSFKKPHITLPDTKLFCVRYGFFYTTLYAPDELRAVDAAASPERTWQVDPDLFDNSEAQQGAFKVEVVQTKPLSEAVSPR